jgi:hypothetical protein
MEVKDFDEFQNTLGLMAKVLQKSMPDSKNAWDSEVRCYFELLRNDFTIQDFRECANYLMKSNKFYPKPCDFYNAREELLEARYQEHQKQIRLAQLAKQEEDRRKWEALPAEEKARITAERQKMMNEFLSQIGVF